MPANEVRILITARDDASRVLSAIRGNAQGMAKDIDQSAQSIEGAFGAVRVGAALASTAILAVGVASVKLASDLKESRNASAETFKASAGAIEAFAAKEAAAFNISKRAAFEYSASLGGIFKASGLGTDAAAAMSTQMVKLAADLASFKNLSIDEALTKIRSGLVGEAEPLRTVGVLLSEAAVKSKAAEMGFTEVNGALTEGQKVQARAAIITQQLADAQGDVARTSGALANQLRNVRQETEDLGAKLGQAFIPAVEKGLQVVSALLSVLNAIPTPILATGVVMAGLTTAFVGFSVAGAIAWKQLNQLAAAYLNVSRAAGVATAAQAAQTAVTAASGATAAGRALGGVGQVGTILGSGARTRFVGNASMQAIQAQRFAAPGTVAAAGGGTFAVFTRAVTQLALRVNPLGLAFGVLTTAATAAAFTMQEFAKQSREGLKDTIARTTGQFAGEVKTGQAAAANLDEPVRKRIEDLRKQLENLQTARTGIAQGIQQASPSALGVTGAASAEAEIKNIDAAIRILTGTLSNLEGPVIAASKAFARTEEEALAGGRGEDIGGDAEEIAKKFWETFKARMADSADREAQQAAATLKDSLNNATIEVFKVSGQKAAEAFKKSLTPELMERVNRRAADLARTLGIDLVSAIGLAISEVGAFQGALNAQQARADAKAQELRDLFSNEGDELRGGLGDLGSTLGGVTNKGEMEAAKPGQTQLNKIPVIQYDAEGRLVPNLPSPSGLNPVPVGQLTGIDRINQLKETTRFPESAFIPSSGGGADSKADPLGDAIQAIRDRFNADLARALVNGGEGAFNDLAVQQAGIRAEISRTADDLMQKLGIDLPTALGLAADAVIGANDAIRSAVESTQNRFKGELADAFVASGGKMDAYNKKLTEQAPILAEIAHRAQQLIGVMGIGFAEAYGLATEAVLKNVDRLKKGTSEGFDFMRKLATRRSAIGLNAIEGFNVRPQVGGTELPTFSALTGSSGVQQDITITRSIGQLIIQGGGEQQAVVEAIEEADEPTLRQLRQTFAEAR